jgi:hypothetical protein
MNRIHSVLSEMTKMLISVSRGRKELDLIPRSAFLSLNVEELSNVDGELIFSFSGGLEERVSGPIALYLSETRIWLREILATSGEFCLQIYFTPFMYAFRDYREVRISLYPDKLQPDHDIKILEMTTVENIQDCLREIEEMLS